MEGFLTGWKAIAFFLGVGTKTAKKYYKQYYMPVYRLPGGSPVAMPHELRIWVGAASDNLKAIEKRKTII
jgi:hypothetical protein